MVSSVELRQERRSLVEQMRNLVSRAEAEKRGLDGLETEQWEKLDAASNALDVRIERLERVERDAYSEIPEPRAAAREIAAAPPRVDDELRDVAFGKYLRNGMQALLPEERNALASGYQAFPETRALAVGTDSAGGYTVSKLFDTTVQTSMLAYGGMMQVATRIPTATGGQLLIPTADDTGNAGAILSENAQVSEQDVSFGQTTIDVFTYSSKLIRVSFQLLQDTFFPLETWLAERLGERLGRIMNTHFTTGDGSSKPYGLVTGSSLGKTGAAGQTSTITYGDLVDLEHSIDPSYRPGSAFMMHDSMLKVLKKLVDGQSRPLWQPGLTVGEPNSILGYPYYINQDVAAPAASAKSLLFGQLSKYYWRDVQGIQVMRLSERYSDYLQVGFMAFARAGGRLIDSGTDPVKYYQHPAS
jgi:HK97 family phage major capsid protein